ncbi:MAG: SIR2 family protein [Acidobacteria bacterium]|nr:SIR2 family protein [Acidobacteriota bacterium]
MDDLLVQALAHDESVVFVGSGVSIDAGLPDWRGFIAELLDYAVSTSTDEKDPRWNKARSLLEARDFLLAAEMLHRELSPKAFSNFITRRFARKSLLPTELHRSITRLPFSFALTTNLDRLLERAYGNPTTCTWKDPDTLFHAIRSNDFAVVKLHGSAQNPLDVRLTRTHYRDGSMANPEFNQLIKHLLSWKTFLFIGYSLRDTDMLYLIDEVRLRHGRKFGPHYAILPEQECDATFARYLDDALAIKAITYRTDGQTATQAVVNILKELSGRVSRARLGRFGIGFGLSDPAVSRDEAVQAMLERATSLTGSLRGDVCMMVDGTSPDPTRVAVCPPKKEALAIEPGSIINSVFLKAAKDRSKDYVYLKDVAHCREELDALGYRNAHYVVCDTEVKSELACPILADGRRVGVLNLESDLRDAYTDYHIQVAKRISKEFGQLFMQAEHRRRIDFPIKEFQSKPDRLSQLMLKSRLVSSLGHEFLLYKINYEKQTLTGSLFSKDKVRHFRYTFQEKSIAAWVFWRRQAKLIPDVEEAVKGFAPNAPDEDDASWLNPKGISQFGIKGPLFACPVRAAGDTQAILVTWLRDGVTGTGGKIGKFKASSRQIQRRVNLAANDLFRLGQSRVEGFFDGLRELLDVVDKGGVWEKQQFEDKSFCTAVIEALATAVLRPEVGLKRIRFWRAVDPENQGEEPREFRLVYWKTADDVRDQPAANYIGLQRTSERDVFTEHTLDRYREDPLAKWQHPAKMGGEQDPNATKLDKDPKGSWIVAPIVKSADDPAQARLLGWISADMHMPDEAGTPKDRKSEDSRERTLQRLALDVVSDLSHYVFRNAFEEPVKAKAAKAVAGSSRTGKIR